MYSTINIPYSVLQFNAHNKLKEVVLEEINKLPISSITSFDHSIYNSDWNINDALAQPKYALLLKDDLEKELSQVFLKFGFNTFTIHNIWFQQYILSNSHSWHNHAGCHYTCIYYLELPETAPPTQFISPLNNSEIFQIEVKEGDILIMPSMIKHRSPTIDTNVQKTIISFNVSLVFDNQTKENIT